MMGHVKTNRGIALDGISDKLFSVGKDCRRDNVYCESYRRKITFASEFLKREYWEIPDSELHLKGRLVTLNKKHPKMP
jgi:hypothetical protein